MMKFVICLALVALAQGFPQKALKPQGSKIVGGEPAARNEFPYQVTLLESGYRICGGSIVNENHIITAAHCLGLSASRYSIVAGEYNLAENDGTEQRIAVSHVFIHEDYQNGDGSYANDIAILRLANPLTFNQAVQKIALPNSGQIANGDVVITGWGRLSQGGPSPNILQKVTIPIVEDAKCEEMYEKHRYLRVNGKIMICAGVEEGGKDSCQGDSGGPLAAGPENDRHLAGVVSWGEGCALPAYPGVYAEVASYLDWINAIIN